MHAATVDAARGKKVSCSRSDRQLCTGCKVTTRLWCGARGKGRDITWPRPTSYTSSAIFMHKLCHLQVQSLPTSCIRSANFMYNLCQLHAHALPTSCTISSNASPNSSNFMNKLCQFYAQALPTSCTSSASFIHKLFQLHVQSLPTLPQSLRIS